MGAPIGKNLAKNGFDVLGFEADNSIKLPEITMMPSITTLVKKSRHRVYNFTVWIDS